MDRIVSDAPDNMDGLPTDVWAVLILLIIMVGYSGGKEGMRNSLKDYLKEHGYENYDSDVDTVIEKLFPPEDGTGSRHPC